MSEFEKREGGVRSEFIFGCDSLSLFQVKTLSTWNTFSQRKSESVPRMRGSTENFDIILLYPIFGIFLKSMINRSELPR